VMIHPTRIRWRLRTVFGENVIVVPEREAGARDPSYRIHPFFVECELREWLLGSHAFDRETLIDMYCGFGHGLASFGLVPRSESHLREEVLPVLEKAFRDGRLIAFKEPAVPVSIPRLPKERTETQSDGQPADWVEVIVTDELGEPYLGPYRLDLPDGRVLS